VGNFRNLKAWQHSQRLAVECSKAARGFPDTDRGRLADQLLRASYSVPLNIAEGTARRGSKELRRFLDTARGSLAEVQSALEIARELEYLSQADFERLETIANEAGRTLWGLLRKVSSSATAVPVR